MQTKSMTNADDVSSAPGMHEAARREKLRRIQELGHDPWGRRFDDHSSIAEIRKRENEIVVETVAEASERRQAEQHGPRVRAAGRIVLQRKKGKLIFLDIRDWSGQIQVFIGRNQVGEENWALAECFDLGDLVGVDGCIAIRNGAFTAPSGPLAPNCTRPATA